MARELNRANRQCCNVDIRDYATNKPWMFVDFCNTTTSGFTGDANFALKKGAKAIAFHNPIEGTMAMTFQVHPFRLYALLSDGVVQTTAVIPVRKDIASTVAGKLDIPTGETPVAGSVFVYPVNEVGATNIEGTLASQSFTATTASMIEIGKTYTVCYLVSKTTGVKKVSFNSKKIPKNYRITQETVDIDEDGTIVPLYITAYKATPQRNLEFSFSSEGEPAEMTITFDVLEDKDSNVLDIVEIETV